MRICCYFIGWNIEDTVALTVNHYKQFCEKVVYLDNYSTDGSWNAALRAGAECRLFGVKGMLDDGEYTKIKNNVWKDTDYDYVIVCDNDEILFTSNIWYEIAEQHVQGATIFKTQGYSMFSNDVPRGSFTEIKTGYKDDKYSKMIIFDPKAITNINYVYGCHEAKPEGRIQWSDVPLPLYHYMGIGGPERMIARHAEYAKRLSSLNQRWGLGIEYTHSAESKRQWFEKQLERSVPLF